MMTDQDLPQTRQANREAYRATRATIQGWRVLVVDDQVDNLSVAEATFQFHGAEVRTACNGAEGMKVLENYDPTLILLDLSMPEVNGWEMFTQLRQNPKTAKILVIALTAHAMEGDEARVMEAGFDGYIPKPYSVMTIVSDIQAILQPSKSSPSKESES